MQRTNVRSVITIRNDHLEVRTIVAGRVDSWALDPQQVRHVSIRGKVSRNDLIALACVGSGQRHDGVRHSRRVVHGDDSQPGRAVGAPW